MLTYYYQNRYVVEKKRLTASGDLHWAVMYTCDDLKEAKTHLAKYIFKFGGEWRVRDRRPYEK